MYANIVVENYLSKEKAFFTYSIPRGLENSVSEGSCVKVTFGKKILVGYVIEILETSNIPNAKDILEPLIPFPVLLNFQIKLAQWMSWYYHAPLLDCLHLMVPPILKGQKTAQIDLSGNIEQVLILASTMQKARELSLKLPPRKFIIFDKKLGRRELFESWRSILEGKVKYILGARSAIFSPTRNCKRIVLIDEEDSSYREEKSPYYHSKLVAAKLSEMTAASLEFRSQTPETETFYWSINKKATSNPLSYVKFSLKITPLDKVKTKIVDLNLHTPKKGFSTVLLEEIEKVLERNGTILLFLNKTNNSGYVQCKSCGLKEYQETPVENCPRCASFSIKFSSFNVSSVTTQVKRNFPEHQDRFLVSTQSILYSEQNQKFDLVGVISADTILNLPGYKSGEKTFQLLRQLSQLVKTNGKFILQTYNPNHSSIKCFSTNDYFGFYRQEIEERKTMGYPPFKQLIRLSLNAKNREKAVEKVAYLMNYLKQDYTTTEILGPNLQINRKNKAVYRLILRGNNLQELLINLPKEWRVEVDPEIF